MSTPGEIITARQHALLRIFPQNISISENLNGWRRCHQKRHYTCTPALGSPNPGLGLQVILILSKCKREPHMEAIKVKGQGKFSSVLLSTCKDTGENKKGWGWGIFFFKQSKVMYLLVTFLSSHIPPVWQESCISTLLMQNHVLPCSCICKMSCTCIH